MAETRNVWISDIYSELNDFTCSILYQLLAEREANEAISHAGMPTFQQHVDFIYRKPYKLWYLVRVSQKELGLNDAVVGSIYLSYQNEIGVAIFKKYRRRGYGKIAIEATMRIANEKFYLANINPANAKSIVLFRDALGFELIQETYKLEYKNAVS